MDHGDGNYKPSPDELKLTPNSAMELRFGRGGESRPHASAASAEAERKPVNLKRVRNRTDNLFGMAFAGIGVLMVAGALGVLWFIRSSGTPDDPVVAEAPIAPGDAAPEEEKELQGGVKVRKGFGDN